MNTRGALKAYNDEMRTLLLNVLYYQLQERRYTIAHVIANAAVGACTIIGLMLWGTKHITLAFVFGFVAALLAWLRVVSDLKDCKSHYAQMRGKYNSLYTGARHVHKAFVDGEIPVEELAARKNVLTEQRLCFAKREDSPSPKRIRKLQKKVVEYLPLSLLWPTEVCPRENQHGKG